MGCGISRFNPRHHHHGLHRHGPSTEIIGDVDHSDINITKDSRIRGSRLLFFTYHGEDNGRRSVSLPLSPIHLKHIPQMESPVTQGNVGRRKPETRSDAAGDHNPDLERKSDAKLYINNQGGEEDDSDPRISNCNLGDHHNGNGGASPLFMGSPSFREYCFVGCRSADDDNLIKSSHINDIGNKNIKEREDDIRASDDQGSAGSNNNSSVAGVKRTRGVRKLRKGGSSNHRAGAVRRSLMNVALCYHHHHHNHTLPSPVPNTHCTYKLPQH